MTDWRDIREQFPITANYTYLNAAAAGPLARTTAQGGVSYYEQMKNGGSAFGQRRSSGSRAAKKCVPRLPHS